ncbi:hypothetical protein VaNZ11_000007 [Volvox africanus]|uniref:Rad21/Rec8-like protein N-terminal domain-containing protein n=1 Tax=Volvox africanus TaxID=51714 RepID=A0ABQ5RL26_9CHLO|nr:hypothetical protein VaNZ11_000007 [Volvox africanus]
MWNWDPGTCRTMAHGKKLSKLKILGISVSDVCKHIMQPDVPHSLRLQGILIGGVVIVFNRQQLYLLGRLREGRTCKRCGDATGLAQIGKRYLVIPYYRRPADLQHATRSGGA